MKSVLDVQVSCFASYAAPDQPKPVNLLTWLTSDKYAQQVAEIRQIEEKKARDRLKAALPAITPSGLFSRRAADALLRHSGLIQFDIDLKDNLHIQNYSELRQEIGNIANIAYCGLSVSGQGYWGLVPILDPSKHVEYYESLKSDFLTFGIRIDPLVKSVASLRGYSYDPNAYFNHEAIAYQKVFQLEKIANDAISISEYPNEYSKVEAYIIKIELEKIDLTAIYYNWFIIGCALANAFGQNGRNLFHRISVFHPKYNFHKTDRKFTNCMNGKYNYSLGSFYRIVHQAGIKLP